MYPKYTVCLSSIIAIFTGLSLSHQPSVPSTKQQDTNTKHLSAVFEALTNSTTAGPNITEEVTANVSSEEDYSDYYEMYSDEFIGCTKITLSPDEYVLLQNNSIYVPTYATLNMKSVIEPGNYYIEHWNETSVAYICRRSTVISSQAERESRYVGTSTYITYTCLCVSLLSLALHFLAFLIVPEMRNLPGWNMASLTFSLFWGYLLFLVGIQFDRTPVCHPLGICIYYFMMVSFLWMNVISYDVFRSVRDATAKLRTSAKSAQTKRFLFYSFYSWMLPVLPLTVLIAAEETTVFPSGLRPLFNENRCWFRQRLAVLVFFAIPAAILMIINASFFIACAVLISSNSMRSNKHKSNLKRNILLYLKLIVICGLLWITGLVEDFVHNEALSYVILALFTLQGLYIFIAFTRFRKIINRFSKRGDDAVSNNRSAFNSTVSHPDTSRRTIIKEMK